MDLTESIAPNSTQMDAEDLLSGPRTFTVTEVRKGSAEQPVDIFLAEFPRPFRPSKTVRRILVAAWGKEASVYVGRRMTLYRDPSVLFAGQAVGGIRVSHLSHIDKPLSLALMVTRGKRAAHVVEPLPDDAPRPTPLDTSSPLAKAMFAALNDVGITDKPGRLLYVSDVLGREIGSSMEMTEDDARAVLRALDQDKQQPTTTEGDQQ